MDELLIVKGLTVEIVGKHECHRVLNDVSFSLHKSEIVGLVGESGCGKSMTALSVMGLLPGAARVRAGYVQYGGRNLLSLSEEMLCKTRGKDISIIFQEPMTALNPIMPVGTQISEAYLTHNHGAAGLIAKNAALEMMRQVGLSRAESLYWEYPHQLSGGMKQRIVIAMALINRPDVLIADEPTTALDVTIQYQILRLMKELSASLNTAIMLVSHDLGIVREMCDRIIVMYAGYVVEEGKTKEVLADPKHPYTKQLLASIPTVQKRGQELYSIPGTVAPLQMRKSGVCPFAERCANACDACNKELPALTLYGGRKVRCLMKGGV
ncbi:MAG: ABC transporter ATP-binding protein [Anaerocolumna sp.]